MLEVTDINAYYGAIQALKDVSIAVGERQIVSIIGANGAGKTTLLRTISGLTPSKGGSISYDNRDVSGLPPAKIVGLGICQVPEGRQLFTHLTVIDNLRLGAYLHFKKRLHREIDEQLERVFIKFPILKERPKQIAGTLSGGEQQMLAIGRALMSKPKLLLLDEPTMGLAPLVIMEIFRVIRKLHKGGTTILLVEQNARLALRIGSYGYVLDTGEVTLEGKAMELLDNKDVKQAYLGR